jgi:hypothetical protein
MDPPGLSGARIRSRGLLVGCVRGIDGGADGRLGTKAISHHVLASASPIPHGPGRARGVVEVSVPRSGFPATGTERPAVHTRGRLRLLSDSLLVKGGRTSYCSAVQPGTATISSTVDLPVDQEVPWWSGLVVVG